MRFSVRPATEQDTPFLAEVMHDSTIPVVGHGLFDTALEGLDIDPLKFNEALILSGANHWGYLDTFVVLEEDGVLAGACAAYLSGDPDRRPITPDGLKRVADWLGWTPDQARAFMRKYYGQFGIFPDLPQLFQPADYVLEYTGIKSEFRGQGLLQPIIDAHVERARKLGHKTMGVSATIGNDRALKGYLKCGFRFLKRVGPEEYGNAFPGMDRLIMDL